MPGIYIIYIIYIYYLWYHYDVMETHKQSGKFFIGLFVIMAFDGSIFSITFSIHKVKIVSLVIV